MKESALKKLELEEACDDMRERMRVAEVEAREVKRERELESMLRSIEWERVVRERLCGELGTALEEVRSVYLLRMLTYA
jgi:hypothetical protein